MFPRNDCRKFHFPFFPPFLARFFRFDVPEAVLAAAARSSSFSASDMAALYASSYAVQDRTSSAKAPESVRREPHQILYDTRTGRLFVGHPEHSTLGANRDGFEQELVKLFVLAEQADHRADEEVAVVVRYESIALARGLE